MPNLLRREKAIKLIKWPFDFNHFRKKVTFRTI